MVPFTASHLSDDAEVVCLKSWTRYALNLAELCGLLVVAVSVSVLSETAGMVLTGAAAAPITDSQKKSWISICSGFVPRA